MTRIRNSLVQPFLKWAGGKRQLLDDIQHRLPKKYVQYYEPFVGGGAVLFRLQPTKAVINDSNAELMNVYKIVQTRVEDLIEELAKHKNTKEHYYRIRELDRTQHYHNLTSVQRAARIIYLNKTCYNGLFRVNSQGQFNVPFGSYKNPEIVNAAILKAVSNYLNNAAIQFHSEDFETVIASAKKGSFVYFDPPYDPVSDTSSFTGYTLDGFGESEQERLKEACDRLHKKGCFFLLSNSATEFIRGLYRDYTIDTVHVGRNINSIASKRGKIEEVLVRNY